MFLRLLHWITAHRPTRRIEAEDGALYLLRIKLWGWMPGDRKKYRFSAYLHRFFLPDLDRALHNHPWRWSVSFILWGGYDEERLVEGHVITRRVRPFTLNWLGPNDFHRVMRLRGRETWTLFFAGPKYKGWGFLEEGRFIPYAERFKQRGIEREVTA